MSDEPDDYAVGYGRPPRHTQFKKGQSGNPKGRPKGARGLRTELREEMNQRITIREGGKAVRISKRRALVKRLTEKALNGDIGAIRTLSDMHLRLLEEVETGPAPGEILPENDRSIIENYIARQLQRDPGPAIDTERNDDRTAEETAPAETQEEES